MENCPSLNGQRVCSTLSGIQGWSCAVDVETCAKCAGPSDLTYLTVLGQQLDRAALSHPSLPTPVVDALAKRYPDKAAAMKAGEEYRAKKGWEQVRETWAKAESLGKSLLSRGVGDRVVGLPQLQARHVSCHGTTLAGATVASPCSKRQPSQDGTTHFCGACGCGDTKIARLDGDGYTKLHYPHLECPLERAGFSNQKLKPVAFSCHGGIGDLCIHAWMAEGYRAQGGECGFVGATGSKLELLQSLGQVCWETFEGEVIVTGGSAKHYQFEVKVDKGARARALVWSERLGGLPLKRPTLTLSQRDVEKADRVLKGANVSGNKPLVLLFPHAEWKPRVWPLNYWMDLYWSLRAAGCDVLVLAGDASYVEAFKDNAIAGHTWGVVSSLMQRASLVVANDSGPAHVAGTLGVNTVALMGPTSNIFNHYQTVREASMARASMPCTGCHFDGARGFRAACDIQCESLMNLKPARVLEACREALANPLQAVDSWELPADAST